MKGSVNSWSERRRHTCHTSPTVFGVDAYPDLLDKAAALLQSLARNHALVDGNKRTAWAAAWTFLIINGFELAADFDVDRAEDLMNEVATAECSLSYIAETLAGFAATRPPQPPATAA